MGVVLIAVIAGCLVGAGVAVVFDVVAAILPAVATTTLLYFFLGRRIAKQMEGAMQLVQVEMQKGANHVPRAIEMLEALKKKYGRLQFFSASSIDGQIGTILFMQQKYKEARPYLERAFVRLWQAKVMLAVLDAKKKAYGKVDENLERVAKYAPKQGLMWSTWAYIHWKAGNRDRAIALLNRGDEALKGADETLKQNLLALKNGQKMKMKGYGDAWYQFGLETHPMMKKAQRGNVRFARR